MIQKILVVDDDPEIVNGFADIFRQRGLTVFTAFNADEFERVCLREIPDLIILDIFLGEDSGPDAYDRVMKSGFMPKTPVIFLSGKLAGSTESPLVKGRQVALYLKPVAAERLLNDMDAAFENCIVKIA